MNPDQFALLQLIQGVLVGEVPPRQAAEQIDQIGQTVNELTLAFAGLPPEQQSRYDQLIAILEEFRRSRL